jgi:hypothetical protein
VPLSWQFRVEFCGFLRAFLRYFKGIFAVFRGFIHPEFQGEIKITPKAYPDSGKASNYSGSVSSTI